MSSPPTPHCSCGLALQPYVSLSLHDGQRRQSYVAHISVALAWTPSAGAGDAPRQPLRGVWAANADDLLRFGDDRPSQPPQHDVHFYVRTTRGAIEGTMVAAHTAPRAVAGKGDNHDGR